MESEKSEIGESDIQTLMRITVAGFERIDKRFEAIGERFEKIDERLVVSDAHFAGLDKRIDSLGTSLAHKIDQLEIKVDKNHDELKTDLAALKGVMTGQVRTIADHETRITTLETQ